MRKLVGGALLSGALLVCLVAPGSAAAVPAVGSATIGATFAPATTAGGGQECPGGFTAAQTTSTAARYEAPFAGVITSWQYQAAATVPQLKLKVFRRVTPATTPNDFLVVGTSSAQTPTTSTLNSFTTSIAVQAGDIIGATYISGGPCADISSGENFSFLFADPADGNTSTYSTFSNAKLDISATLETDHDSDGLGDQSQDPDDDNDTVADGVDFCAAGDLGWTSSAGTDYDSDGCRDAGEDTDDDNDTVADGPDDCETGVIGPGNDPDGDGCKNSEDTDDDNDTVADGADNCALVANLNQTNTDGDAEGDACDADDDNDTVNDGTDNCQLVANTNQTNTDGDAQGDACDPDDDNDTVADGTDNCALVANTNQTNTDGDAQGDACDADDDNDGVDDTADGCPTEAAATADGCPLKPGPPDTTPPDVKINSGPAGKTKDTTPTFTFSSTDASAHFTCSVDGKPATSCSSPFTTSKLKKGKHTFAVVATDAAGNASAPASQTFTVKKKKKHHH
jgi:hypothetical protein